MDEIPDDVMDAIGDLLESISALPSMGGHRAAAARGRTAAAYGASTVERRGGGKRTRRTRSELDQLDAQIIAELVADHPQSTRHVFYTQTNPRLAEPVEKSDRGYRHVQRRCLELRRSGRVPWSWITDTSRMGYHIETYRGAEDFLQRNIGNYRHQLWEDSSVQTFCEVWTESRSMASVLYDTCRELAVSLYPAGGFTSASFAYGAAQGLNDQGVTTVFYVGDFDPAGVLIDQHIERELRSHLKPGVVLNFHRIAITPDQIEQYDLPEKPRNPRDKRSKQITHTVEAEAMPAGVMRDLVRSHIEALLPDRLLQSVREAEQSERGVLEWAKRQIRERIA